MGDWLLFWARHYNVPALTDREQVAMCAAVRFPGFCLQVRGYRYKNRLRRG